MSDHASPDPASVTTSQFYISAGGGTSAEQTSRLQRLGEGSESRAGVLIRVANDPSVFTIIEKAPMLV